MDIEIQVLEWPQADLDELAELVWESRLASPLWMEGQSVNLFKNYIEQSKGRWPDSKLVTAQRDGKLVGWLALITEDPLIFELWRWHPFIKPGEEQEPIADQLLQACKGIAAEKGAQNLEVCCHFQKGQINAEVEAYYQIIAAWYEKNGLKKNDEAVYLTSPVGEIELSPPAAIPEPFSIVEYQPDYVDQMYSCYLEAFSSGQDRSYLNKTEQQRKAMFHGYLENELNQKASLVLLEGDRVKGFTLIQTRERVEDEHLALIAVAPGNQNQGWGRKLITASVQGANLKPDKIFSIGVDLSNQIAYQLYSSMVFEAQTKLVAHIWKKRIDPYNIQDNQNKLNRVTYRWMDSEIEQPSRS